MCLTTPICIFNKFFTCETNLTSFVELICDILILIFAWPFDYTVSNIHQNLQYHCHTVYERPVVTPN